MESSKRTFLGKSPVRSTIHDLGLLTAVNAMKGGVTLKSSAFNFNQGTLHPRCPLLLHTYNSTTTEFGVYTDGWNQDLQDI